MLTGAGRIDGGVQPSHVMVLRAYRLVLSSEALPAHVLSATTLVVAGETRESELTLSNKVK